MDTIGKILYIIVPCYNEHEVLPITNEELNSIISNLVSSNYISSKSRILYVDDGSKDNTWDLISSFYQKTIGGGYSAGLKLAHNVGHQNALWAGLTVACDYCDCVISIDADLQDDPEVIKEMVSKYLEGYEVVLGVRSTRKKDSLLKRVTAECYYKLLSALGVETVYNHADFRLLGKKALSALLEWKESNLYLRGIIPRLGFKSCNVYFERQRRAAGESKYTIPKMFGLALNGITSFSTKLLSLDLLLSLVMLVVFIVLMIVMGVMHVLDFQTAVLPSLFLCSSILLFSRYIHGIYLGKEYIETKHRPKYAIEELKLDDE